MKQKVQLYFEELIARYGEEVHIDVSKNDNEKLEKVPAALHPLYQFLSKATFPFGCIFDIDTALRESKNAPFPPDWFVFGQDSYFSFWLCSYCSDEKGLSFTWWDHDSGSEIGEAIDGDIVSCLRNIEEEYQEFLEEGEKRT